MIPGLGRSPGEGNGYPLQYFCLENSMDRGAWQVQSIGLQRVRQDGAPNTFYTPLPHILLYACQVEGHKEPRQGLYRPSD